MKRCLLLLFGLSLMGAPLANAEDTKEPSENQEERAEIAKVAVEWLLLDDWKKPKPEYAYPRTRTLPYLNRLRRVLSSSDNESFPVGILGKNDQVEESALYNRTTKKLAPAPAPLHRQNPELIKVAISAAKAGWNVKIANGATYFRIEVAREDRGFYVSKFNGAFSMVD